jgi:hypothetical protein
MPRTEGVDHSPQIFDGQAGILDPSDMESGIRIQAGEHLVDPAIARSGDKLSRPVRGRFSGSLHQKTDGEDHRGDGEDQCRRDHKSSIITLDRKPEDRSRHDGEQPRERPWIFEHKIGKEAGASNVGHGDLPKNSDLKGGRVMVSIRTNALERAYPFEEVAWV